MEANCQSLPFTQKTKHPKLTTRDPKLTANENDPKSYQNNPLGLSSNVASDIEFEVLRGHLNIDLNKYHVYTKSMKATKSITFVLLAFLIGGVVSQLPLAFADSSNPLKALWDSINALDKRQQNLQAQIDELKAQVGNERKPGATALAPEALNEPSLLSESSVKIELKGDAKEPGKTMIHLISYNAGPDDAVGVKVTFFYNTKLLHFESISEEQCEKPIRGIVQCFLGSIKAEAELSITIAANAIELGKEARLVADISSITEDADPSNNHVGLTFVTGEIKEDGAESSLPSIPISAENNLPASNTDSGDEAGNEDSSIAPPQNATSDYNESNNTATTVTNGTNSNEQTSAESDENGSANGEKQEEQQQSDNSTQDQDTGDESSDGTTEQQGQQQEEDQQQQNDENSDNGSESSNEDASSSGSSEDDNTTTSQ